MITPFSVLQAVIAGFSLTNCVIVIILIWARKSFKPLWPLAVMSFTLIIFSLSKMYLNSTQTALEALKYYRIMSVSLPLIFPMILLLYKMILLQKMGWIEYIIIALYAIYSIGNVITPLTLDYASIGEMIPMNLGWFGTIYSAIGWQTSKIFPISRLIHIGIIFYCLYLAWIGWKRNVLYAGIMMILPVIIICSFFYNFSITTKIVHAPSFAEFIGFFITLCFGVLIFLRERKLLEEKIEQDKIISSAYKKIEAINEQLTETNKDLKTEIATRMNIEESLRTSQERYMNITNNIPGFIYQFYQMKTGEQGLSYVDKRSFEMFGIEVEPLDTWFERFSSCFSPEDRNALINSISTKTSKADSWSFEGYFNKPTGGKIYIKAFSQPVKFEDKSVWNGLVLDNTEYKLAEEKLRKSEELFSTIFLKSPMSMAILNLKTHHFIEVNKAWCDLTGYSKEECLSKLSAELGLWTNMEQQQEYVKILLKNSRVDGFEFKSRKKSGELLDMLMFSEMINLDGEICVLSIGQDITARKKTENALYESEERYKLLFELSPDSIMVHCKNKFLMANKSALNLLKVDSFETLSKINYLDIVHPDFRDYVIQRTNSTSEVNESIPLQYRKLICLDGSIIDTEVTSVSCILNGEKVFQVFIRDISERKSAELALKANEEKFRALFNGAADAFFLHHKDGRIIDVNRVACESLGYTHNELLNLNILDIECLLDEAQLIDLCDRVEKNHYVLTEGLQKKKTGETFPVDVQIIPFVINDSKCIFASARDITTRKIGEEALKKSLIEKETLLRELYHRTKNNMQVISSLLQLQSGSVTDEGLLRILTETSSRIKTMALVHQKLYQSNDLSYIDLREYTTDLVFLLFKLFTVKPDKIKIDFDLTELKILIDYAVPIGLVINEIVSNVFKYAFPGDIKGKFSIKMFRDEKNSIEMIFEDNGVGLPVDLDHKNPGTLGLQLIHSLVEDQLGGSIEIVNSNGVKISILFADDLYEKRV